MKNGFKIFFIIWLILFVMLNVCAFAIPKIIGQNFFVVYITVVISFIIELLAGCISFNQKEIKNQFYNMPALFVSSIGLIIILVIGICGFFIADFPTWAVVVVCTIIIGTILIMVVATKGVADNASRYDDRLKG